MKCAVCNGTGFVGIGDGIRGIKKCECCGGAGEVATYRNGVCENCGAPMPTDDVFDFIPDSDVKYCYNCGAKVIKYTEKVKCTVEFEAYECWEPGKEPCQARCPFSVLTEGKRCLFLRAGWNCPLTKVENSESVKR